MIGSVGAVAGSDAGAAGTWTLGSVNFDLTGTVVGTHEIENFWRENIDGIANTIGELPGTGPGASGYVTLVPIPEPGTVSLLGLGIVGLVLAGRRRNR
ncbi:MAG: PEP-CTERM sorting domain-containing protein [bacterium]|nr:PEP-CTERM sorting domain-containing protein [bacterium]